jgi:tetratricopeptide (TPR) repeat protein
MISVSAKLGLHDVPPKRVLGFASFLLFTQFPLVAQQAASSADFTAARSAMTAGIAATALGNLNEAKRDFARAVSLAPKISATHAALGSVELAQNDVSAALKELTLAHKLDPKDSSIDLNLARADVAVNHFYDAVSLFRDALAASPAPVLSDDESLAYASALAATQQPTAAEAILRSALSRTPDSAPLNDALGSLLAHAGSLDQALPFFQHAVAADSTSVQSQYHLGTALLALNRAQDALVPLQLALAATPNSFDVELQLGCTLSALHQDKDALIHLRHAVELQTSNISPSAVYALAVALQASGDPKSSLPLFQSVLSSPSMVDSSALINEALAHVQTGDATGSLPLYARALSLGPDTATLREDFGVAFLQQSDLSHAIEQFRSGLALEPNNAHLHYDLALALKLKDDLAAAIPEFERSAQLDPELPDPIFTLGVIHMQQGHFPDAVDELEKVTALQPDNGDAWALLGSVLKDSGDPAAAAEAFKRAIELQPDQPSLHIQLATIESQSGLKDAAASERRIAADLSRAANARQRASFALKSGRALIDDNKLPDAILQLNTAIQADPTLPEPHTLLADAYTRQGRTADAAVERQRAYELEQQHDSPHQP